jgi:hypothetical protein
MYPEDPNQQSYDPRTRVSNELSVMQPGERVICDIKRHPIGIIGIYVAIVFMLFIAAVLAFILVPGTFGDTGSDQAQRYAAGLFAIVAVAGLLYSLVATYVYWNNKWVVTSDSITQVAQSGLFNRQSAQLGLESLEDITAEQNGMLTHIFHYGVLKAETAGHRSKFVFNYCPNPNFYAQKILEAREALEGHGVTHATVAAPVPPQPQPGPGSYPSNPV